MECVLIPSPGRRAARRHDRREAILDVAAKSFLDNGFGGTTMSGIAAALGGSKGTLWSYFRSKEQLFAAVLERVANDFRADLGPILTPDDAVENALRRFCREFVRKVTKPEALAMHRLVVGEASRFPEMGRIFFECAPGRIRELLADYLAKAMARGALLAGDAHDAALYLTGMCLSGCHLEMLYGTISGATDARIEHDVDRALGLFLRAYRP